MVTSEANIDVKLPIDETRRNLRKVGFCSEKHGSVINAPTQITLYQKIVTKRRKRVTNVLG